MLMLQSRDRVPASEIAGALEVSVRTVMRDVDALSLAGVPIYSLRGPKGGIALLPGFNTDLTGMTTDESRALFVLLSGAAHTDLGLRAALESALRKLMAAIPASQRSDADLTSRRIIIEPHAWRAVRPTRSSPVPLSLLQEVVFNDHRVRINYRRGSDGVTKSYTLDSYGLVNKAGTWYLIADNNGEPRMFRADRMLSAEELDEDVQRRAGVELEAVWEYLRKSVDEVPTPLAVTVRVRLSVLRLFMRMHAYDLANPDNGWDDELVSDGTWAQVELRFNSVQAAQTLLAFGTDVYVLAPVSVRDALANVARATAAHYSSFTPD